MGVGEECTVACQPVLFDCQPNKPNGNSPLERERERERHIEIQKRKNQAKRRRLWGEDALRHTHMLGLCAKAKAEGCRSSISKLLGRGCNYCPGTLSSE